MRAVIAAAKKRGKLAVVHIGSYSGAVDAIEAGADALVHLFADRAPEIRSSVISRRHRVFIVPTMTVPESVGGNAGGAALVESGSMAPWLDETSLRRRSGSGRLFLSYRRRSVQIESLNVFFFRTYLHEWLFSRTSRR